MRGAACCPWRAASSRCRAGPLGACALPLWAQGEQVYAKWEKQRHNNYTPHSCRKLCKMNLSLPLPLELHISQAHQPPT